MVTRPVAVAGGVVILGLALLGVVIWKTRRDVAAALVAE